VIKHDNVHDVLRGIALQRLEESPLAEQATDLRLAAF
jgi:hypothetical protein